MAAEIGKVRLTMLNSMAGGDFVRALDRHVEWGIRVLDLKDGIFGKALLDLGDAEISRAAELIGERGLAVYCLSTVLFHDDVAVGEDFFRKKHLAKVARAVEIAKVLCPRFVRLLPAKLADRKSVPDSIAHLRSRAPWLFGLYREAAEQIRAAGFEPTVETETGGSILANPREIAGFFEAVGAGAGLSLTWDVQNLWECGTFPSMAVCEELLPRLAFFHLKGGQAETPGGPLRWASSLAEASWPVVEITRRVIASGRSPVICLNPSHGERRPKAPGEGGPSDVERDIAFLRANFKEIER